MKQPKILHTDLDLKGNELHNVVVAEPSIGTSPTPKSYVDDYTTLDTDLSNRFDKSLVEVGGIDTDTSLNELRLKDVMSTMLYPRIAPEYTESEVIVTDTDVNWLLGVTSIPSCTIDIDLGDRLSVIGNVTCIYKYPLGGTGVNYVNPDPDNTGNTSNIACTFSSVSIDPEMRTEFSIYATCSSANTKVDNYGDESITSEFSTNKTIITNVSYKGILPLYYTIIGIDETPNVDVMGDSIPWSTVTGGMTLLDNLTMYSDNIGTREVTLTVPTDQPYKVVLMIPETAKHVYICGTDVLEFADTKVHYFTLPNTLDDYQQKYTGVEFTTGNVAFNNSQSLNIIWESANLVKLVNESVEVTYSSGTSSSGITIVDDLGVEYPNTTKLHVTNAPVTTSTSETSINVHKENADVNGGYYDE